MTTRLAAFIQSKWKQVSESLSKVVSTKAAAQKAIHLGEGYFGEYLFCAFT